MNKSWESYRVDLIGISCYSSRDLRAWKNEGLVLSADKSGPNPDLRPEMVIERPKVVFNAKTNQYVMWMHVDSIDYQYARAGVAVADRPQGPFRYLGSVRPENAMARDLTLFQDEDGKAYLIYASENNATLYVSLLTDDFLKPSGRFVRILPDKSREAPAIFKHEGKYYLITSGCTGWSPNAADCAVADSMFGPWTSLGNPCAGTEADVTFGGQGTYVFAVQGTPGRFILMLDRWNKTDLGRSDYLWLPIELRDGGVRIPWRDQWDFSVWDVRDHQE